MPPRLADYGPFDWIRLRPFIHRLKTAKYKRMDRRFRQLPPGSGDLAALVRQIRGRRVLATISFNDERTIAWQSALVRRFVKEAVYFIADNSTDDLVAAEIAKLALARGIPYVRLPRNPSGVPSRSHGLALNWVWENIIKPGAPQVFGFLDDDIYPTAPDDPFAALSEQRFYGVVRPSISSHEPRWFLWAGFCMFRYQDVKSLDLDFSQDWFCGLDTGGANWDRLYRHVERFSVREQPTEFVAFREGIRMEDGPLQWCGPWLHAVGLMGKPELMPEKAAAIAKILEVHLADAAAAL
jgi:hypothetical protein